MITRPINPARTPLLRAARAAVRALALAACVSLPVSACAQNQGLPMQPAQWAPTTGPLAAPVNAQPTPSSMPMTDVGTGPSESSAPPHRWSSHPRETVYNPPCNGPASFCNVYFGN